MKLNWGAGVSIALALFISFIVFLVVVLMSKNVDLESADYYKREVNYQTEIKQQQNAERFKNPIAILNQKEFLILKVPDSLTINKVDVRLIRPNDQEKDKSYVIEGTKSFLIPKSELTKGIYKVEFHYMIGQYECLQKVQIQL